MCLKNKIIAVTLCALVAGIGMFGINASSARAQSTASDSSMSVEQMQQTILSLQKQIQQLIQVIAQLKSSETCGNGICRFGETAASCPTDCSTNSCTPKSCVSQNYECGALGNGCGATLNCGNCAFGKICSAGKCQSSTASIASGCVGGKSSGCAVCNAAGNAWLNIDSNCASGQKCVNGICAANSTSTTDTEQHCTANCSGKVCGSDGCGGSCGTCASGKTCSASQCVNAGTTTSVCAVLDQKCAKPVIASSIKTSTDCCDGFTCQIGLDGTNGTCIKLGVCGNGACERGETWTSCPKDCPKTNGSCGNGYCNCNETATTCPSDCEGKECIDIPNCGTGRIDCTDSNCKIYCNNVFQKSVVWGFSVTTDGNCGNGSSRFCGVPMK